MLRLNLAAIALALASTAAIDTSQAADIFQPEGGSLKDGPVYAPVNTWTGFYIGGNGGYAWSDIKARLSATSDDADGTPGSEASTLKSRFNSEGGFGGGQIGYNWQRSQVVFGIEADIQGADISGRKTVDLFADPGPAGDDAEARVTGRSKLDWFGTVRGRLGYSFGQTLIYATGGFAYGGVKDTLSVTEVSIPLTTRVSKDDTATGFVVGGGLEYALSPAWSLKGEYQFMDLGRTKLSATSADAGLNDIASGSLTIDHTYHTVRIGLNYHIHQDYEPLK